MKDNLILCVCISPPDKSTSCYILQHKVTEHYQMELWKLSTYWVRPVRTRSHSCKTSTNRCVNSPKEPQGSIPVSPVYTKQNKTNAIRSGYNTVLVTPWHVSCCAATLTASAKKNRPFLVSIFIYLTKQKIHCFVSKTLIHNQECRLHQQLRVPVEAWILYRYWLYSGTEEDYIRAGYTNTIQWWVR